MDIVVLAGGRCSPELAAASGVSERAMLPIDGEPIVERVLRAVESLGPVIVVGGPKRDDRRWAPAGATFLDSIAAGLAMVESKNFLLVTGDLPFLTPQALVDFVERCDFEAMLNYPIVRIEDAEAQFPGMKRTSLALREGRFTGGNVAMIDVDRMRRSLPVLESAYAARKSPLRLAAMVGVATLLRVALAKVIPATLSIAGLEAAVGRFMGDRLKAIVTSYPELGADIDDDAQFLAIQALTSKSQSAR